MNVLNNIAMKSTHHVSFEPPVEEETPKTKVESQIKESRVENPDIIDLRTITPGSVEWEGYLYKQRKLVRAWTPRYLTLQKRILKHYKTKEHAVARHGARGEWTVCRVLDSVSSYGLGASKLQPEKLGFSVETKDGIVLQFIASSIIEKAMWIHMLTKALEKDSDEEDTTHYLGRRSFASSSTSSLQKSQSIEELNSLDSGKILKAYADKFFKNLTALMNCENLDIIVDKLPTFMKQMSKDCEMGFVIEATENGKAVVFKNTYQGREGFTHFFSIFHRKFTLTENKNSSTNLKSKKEVDDQFCYTVPLDIQSKRSSSKTSGKLNLRLTLSPARRVAKFILQFARKERSEKTTVLTVQPNAPLMKKSIIDTYPNCFHQGVLTKRALSTSFRDFEMVGVLGQGGFGTVVLVQRHEHPDELFAIKIIDKASGAESALKERRIMSGVRHPFLACLRFAFQTPTKLYLGMDYYKGGNLYHHMHTSSFDPKVATSAGRGFPVSRARFYAAELALGVAYLHSHGIIYRDLKPDNIMLDIHGHIRLIDFGISKQLEVNDGNEYETTGTVAGSPAYIAPEQLNKQRPQYGMAADWWSFGILLYEFLCGRTPFEDRNIMQMYKKIQTAEIKYERNPPLDPDAVDLMKKLLIRDPEKRIHFDEIQKHKFFEPIDWEKLLRKEIEPEFVPSYEEVMQNVNEHFKNMDVKETVEDFNPPSKSHKNVPEGPRVTEFSFAFDSTRRTNADYAMLDDGWLMQQLKESAAERRTFAEASSPENSVNESDPLSDDVVDGEGPDMF